LLNNADSAKKIFMVNITFIGNRNTSYIMMYFTSLWGNLQINSEVKMFGPEERRCGHF